MKVPLSWIKDFVDIDLPLEELAHHLTMIGLEVDEIRIVGLPMPEGERHEFKINGLAWDAEKIVVAQIDEVMPHPNADRLVLCRLLDGQKEHVVLTGAPNLFQYKGIGPLPKSIKVAYAKEGACLYDGHQPGEVLTVLKRTKIRGVESYSMVCSEKELGISEEHDGIILLDDDAPTGMPLVDYMGDVVFDISILPNMIRNASVLGVARELAATFDKPLRKPSTSLITGGESVKGKAEIQITDPTLNPRFVFGLIRDVSPHSSPYWVQRRLRLAGMRPINSLVDATNYIMLEIGQPLHAFDYDVLVKRSGGKPPTIITRSARADSTETLQTLDGIDRKLDNFTILVTDTAGPLSIAGVMGGAESEITESTRNVLLEGATWNFINVRKTVSAQKLQSEAAYRYSRGIHPALSPQGVLLGLKRMAEWSQSGAIAPDLIDNYPTPLVDPLVQITPHDVQRILGISLTTLQIAEILERLEFTCTVTPDTVLAQVPPHRLDIGSGVIGKADVLEEIARIYGYDAIPVSRLGDPLPPQRRNKSLEFEERVRDTLVSLGLQEAMTYRLTSAERESLLSLPSQPSVPLPYVQLINPISSDRAVMRHSLLASLMDILERNIRQRERLGFFEIGQVFLHFEGEQLPKEPRHLAIVLTGERYPDSWDRKTSSPIDFFDLKGIMEAFTASLHIPNVHFLSSENSLYHPGKCAALWSGDQEIGSFGALHPAIVERYDLAKNEIFATELDLEKLFILIPDRYLLKPASVFPPVIEDIAIIVDEAVPADSIFSLIRDSGGSLLTGVRLFDIFRGDQIGEGKKSLAIKLRYQANNRTLNDHEASQIRLRIVRRLETEINAKLRSE